tara:strand:- start:2585 stop:2977 length:393 start_codon:yes stop_codon:yes gene_type:complete
MHKNILTLSVILFAIACSPVSEWNSPSDNEALEVFEDLDIDLLSLPLFERIKVFEGLKAKNIEFWASLNKTEFEGLLRIFKVEGDYDDFYEFSSIVESKIDPDYPYLMKIEVTINEDLYEIYGIGIKSYD